ncbi:hypothetical protein UPYG_G00146060 [Umbra pygmaea]|uniref:Uncharacterized protein n=1 Tax=Umbra pygmaea TaxID=75934 RepID=A0ABD0WXL3_UMBPY
MASVPGVMDSGPQLGDAVSSNTESKRLLEDLEDQVDSLKDKMDLCKSVLKDLVDLQGILKEKNLRNASFNVPK